MKITKRLAALFLSVLIAVSCFTVLTSTITATVLAEDELDYAVQSPKPEFEYTVKNGKAYITAYNGSDTKLTIPTTLDNYKVEGITGLWGENYGCGMIKELIIPDGIKSVSPSVFYDVCNIEKVTFGKDVTGLSKFAADYNYYLKTISVSSKNKSYASENGLLYNKAKTKLLAVSGYKCRNGIKLSKSVKDISLLIKLGIDASKIDVNKGKNFVKTKGVTYTKDKKIIVKCDRSKSGKYKMPGSVTDMVYGAFKKCKKITEVTVSSKVKSIPADTFAECTGLKKVKFPKKLNSIGSDAFYNCKKLKTASLPDSVKMLGGRAFYNTGISKVKIPKNLTQIVYNAFGKSSISKIEWNKKVEYISEAAFAGCKKLKTVKIPNTVTSIGYKSFAGTSIKEINIPKKVQYIDYAFGDKKLKECKSLKTVYYCGTKEDWKNVYGKETIPVKVKFHKYMSGQVCYYCGYSPLTLKTDGGKLKAYNKDSKKFVKYTGIIKYKGVLYYVKNGVKNTKTNTLVKYKNGLYHVKSGKCNLKEKVTFVKYNKKWYYCKKGVAQTKFTGKVKYKGSIKNVKKGILK